MGTNSKKEGEVIKKGGEWIDEEKCLRGKKLLWEK